MQLCSRLGSGRAEKEPKQTVCDIQAKVVPRADQKLVEGGLVDAGFPGDAIHAQTAVSRRPSQMVRQRQDAAAVAAAISGGGHSDIQESTISSQSTPEREASNKSEYKLGSCSGAASVTSFLSWSARLNRAAS